MNGNEDVKNFKSSEEIKNAIKEITHPYLYFETVNKCPLCGSEKIGEVQLFVANELSQYYKIADMCNDCGILFRKRQREVWKCNFCDTTICENDKICSVCKREIDWED